MWSDCAIHPCSSLSNTKCRFMSVVYLVYLVAIMVLKRILPILVISITHVVAEDAEPIPVWLWMDYPKVPSYIELNIKAIHRNAPEPQFKIKLVTPETIKALVPDMPEEFDRLPYPAAVSDLIRTALLAHYGGLYMDTDFLVQQPLGTVADLLKTYDLVSYTVGGQNCQKGSFSSNFMAGRKNNALSTEAWAAIKTKLKRRCNHKDGTPQQGVCCYTEDGAPRKCHIPWGGIGERTSHPILKDLVATGAVKPFCFGQDESFAPEPTATTGTPQEHRLDMYKLHWMVLDAKPCQRVQNDLVCDYGSHTALCKNFFNRIAYHMFATISASKDVRKLTAGEIMNGAWAASELYRTALKSDGEKNNKIAIDDVEVERPDIGKYTRTKPAATDPIPVWLWVDYSNIPGYVELNLRSILRNAPSPMFDIRPVTREMLKELVPDMPEEFERINYAAAVSDLIRTALLAHYGGIYMDTDFIVRGPLAPAASLLSEYDLVSYVVTGQPCEKGIFSSNFMAARKGNPLSVAAWGAIKTKLKTRCNATSTKQGVCCYSPEGAPRTCNVPWGGIGERTSHPISRQLVADGKLKMFCYKKLESFAPDVTAVRNAPKGHRLNMYLLSWINLDDGICNRHENDLRCSFSGYTSNSTHYFNRTAYHMFAAISADRSVKALTATDILRGNWAASYLYRDALGVGSREEAQKISLAPVPPLSSFVSPRFKTSKAIPLPASDTDGLATEAIVSDAAEAHKINGYNRDFFPPYNERKATMDAVAEFAGRVPQPCSDTYAKWQGKAIDKEDQWQCPIGNVSFVHIPKTAGTTIENLGKKLGIVWGHDYDSRRWDLLKDLEKTNRDMMASLPPILTTTDEIKVCSRGCPCVKGCCWWHVPPRLVLDWRPYYEYPVKFCIVRSPFERVLSQYSWNGKGCPRTQAEIKARNERIERDLRMFKSKNFAMQDCHYLPQSWYISSHIDAAWMKRVWEEKDLSQVLAKPELQSRAEAQSCNFPLRYPSLSQDLAVLAKFTGSKIVLPDRTHKSYTQRCPNSGLSSVIQDLIREIYAEDFLRFGFSTTWPVSE